jgi:hypothetical protein
MCREYLLVLVAVIIWLFYIYISKTYLKYDWDEVIEVPDTKNNDDLLKFEYQELREERNRNTSMNYQILGILLAGGFLIFQKDVLCSNCKSYFLTLIIVLLLGLFYIDRKLTFFNNLRAERMKYIERKLGICNLTISESSSFKIWENKRKWLYENLAVHHIFLLIILTVILFCIYLIIDTSVSVANCNTG